MSFVKWLISFFVISFSVYMVIFFVEQKFDVAIPSIVNYIAVVLIMELFGLNDFE